MSQKGVRTPVDCVKETRRRAIRYADLPLHAALRQLCTQRYLRARARHDVDSPSRHFQFVLIERGSANTGLDLHKTLLLISDFSDKAFRLSLGTALTNLLTVAANSATGFDRPPRSAPLPTPIQAFFSRLLYRVAAAVRGIP